MRLIKVGIASMNTTVGAHITNTDRLIAAAEQMAKSRCTVGAFQEEAIAGYPAEDLVQMGKFMPLQWDQLRRFADATKRFAHPTLYLLGVGVHWKREIYSCNAAVLNGSILGLVPKEDHPTYSIFYGDRTYSRGRPGLLDAVDGIPFGDINLETGFGVVGLNVCEDIWRADGTMLRRCHAGAELFVNVSASPYRMGVARTRERMLAQRSADNEATVVYANQVGGNDSLVFDGGGYVAQGGTILHRAPRWWKERKDHVTTTVVDLDEGARMRRANTTWRIAAKTSAEAGNPVHTLTVDGAAEPNHKSFRWPGPGKGSYFFPADETPANPLEEAYEDVTEALVMGSGDYIEKTGAFDCAGIASSGGKDSTLVAAILRLYAERRFAAHAPEAKKTAIANFLSMFSFPTKFNSEETKNFARDSATDFGATFVEVPIEEAVLATRGLTKRMLGVGLITGNTDQNNQARIRGLLMWNWTNSRRGYWPQTSNKSEKSVGYTTIGGDMMGAQSVIADLFKGDIPGYMIWLARKYGWPTMEAVARSISSAELKEGQSDERDLMPFPILDACTALFVGKAMDAVEVHRVLRETWSDADLLALAPHYKPGMLIDWVRSFMKKFVQNLYKWVQTPEPIHLSDVDLDRERARQLPIVQSLEWLELERFEREAANWEANYLYRDEP